MFHWLLLVHQLPASPTSVRVKTWRRLQDLGAVSLKNAVWVLPASDEAREDFAWITREIEAMKGGAVVFTADSVDAFSNDEVVAAFRAARAQDYRSLADEAAALAKRLRGRSVRGRALRQVRQTEDRLARLEAITFFPPPERDRAAAAVAALKTAVRPTAPAARHAAAAAPVRYAKRTWVTRPRPGVDRMSSAWLIRRFIDPQARFAFADAPPRGRAIPFDMFGVEFGHQGDACTFETLVARFGLADPAVAAIGEIVHDLDLKQRRFGRPETPAFARLVDGLRASYADDGELLGQGMAMFEALYRSFAATGKSAGGGVRGGRRSRA